MMTYARAVRQWCQRPASFVTTICFGVVAIQTMNWLAYVHARNLVSFLVPSSTQLLSLTIGTIFMFRTLQLIGGVTWTLIKPLAPLPPRYKEDDPDLPFVTVQIAMRNEELDVVAGHCIKSAFALNYPAERLEIQLIDNSDVTGHYLAIKRYVESIANQQLANRRPSLSFIHRDGTEGYKGRN